MLETTFSPLSSGKSFMKIRSAVPENGCLVFLLRTKKNKTNKKTSVKHIRMRLIGGCVNKYESVMDQELCGIHSEPVMPQAA